MKFSRAAPFVLLVYVLTVGFGIEAINSAGGGLLQQYYAEYYGEDGKPSGSLKWRSEEGKAFQTVALLFGIWVYPTSLIGAALLAHRAFVVKSRFSKFLCIASAVLCLLIFYRFCSLGVFTAVTAF